VGAAVTVAVEVTLGTGVALGNGVPVDTGVLPTVVGTVVELGTVGLSGSWAGPPRDVAVGSLGLAVDTGPRAAAIVACTAAATWVATAFASGADDGEEPPGTTAQPARKSGIISIGTAYQGLTAVLSLLAWYMVPGQAVPGKRILPNAVTISGLSPLYYMRQSKNIESAKYVLKGRTL
jgi:hypothetical protein